MKLNQRGKQARALLILLGIAIFIWWMVTGFWWTEDGLCVGTMSKCMAGGL